jgi:hypothetical protein
VDGDDGAGLALKYTDETIDHEVKNSFRLIVGGKRRRNLGYVTQTPFREIGTYQWTPLSRCNRDAES